MNEFEKRWLSSCENNIKPAVSNGVDHVKQHQSTVTPSGSSTTTGAHSSRSASKSQRNFLVRWTLNFSALFRNVLSTPGLLANWKKSWNAPTERKDIKNNTYTNKHPQFGKCITIYMLIDKDQSLITAGHMSSFNPAFQPILIPYCDVFLHETSSNEKELQMSLQ